MEVDARFDCPDSRTIVMTIVAGDGVGSVVETHATPLDDERTAIVEATLATSDRPVAMALMRSLGRMLRPGIEARAKKLWIEDAAYCERLAELRRA
jgi:isorenieratene synthase